MTDAKPSSRQHPAHHPAVEWGQQSIVIFVTVCTKNRRAVLANETFHATLCAVWSAAREWWVGRYVIMPDHVHFFCAPGHRNYPALSKWMAYWKGLTARRVQEAQLTTAATMWQRDFWDRQLRSGESYSEKWAYVRANPVRAGLVERPEDWPYQGELNVLQWHDA